MSVLRQIAWGAFLLSLLQGAAASASHPGEKAWNDFLDLFEDEKINVSLAPKSFFVKSVDFEKGALSRTVRLMDSETKRKVETFLFPEREKINAGALRPYFMSLQKATVLAHPEALVAHTRLHYLLKEFEQEDLLRDLESQQLPAEQLVTAFPKWLAGLKKSFVSPYKEDPISFLREHGESLEWFQTTFRGWFLLEEGKTLSFAQFQSLWKNSSSNLESLVIFVQDLFTHFTDAKMAAWEKDYFEEVTVEGMEGLGADQMSDIPLAPEDHKEQRLKVRRKMLLLYHMVMQPYYTVRELLDSVKLEGVEPESHEDFMVQEVRFRVFESFFPGGADQEQEMHMFSPGLHFEPVFLEAQKGVSDFADEYADFMGRLLDGFSEQGLRVVRNPYLRANTKELLEIKVPVLHSLIPAVEASVQWFLFTGPGYVKAMETALNAQAPEDAFKKTWEKERQKRFEKLHAKAKHYLERGKYWNAWYAGLPSALEKREAQLKAMQD